MLKGIDVAHHQGNINWDKVKSDGIQFAVLRMGIGSDIPSQTDKKVLRNAKECERVGIPYGLYIYSYALNESDAHSEASHMLRIAGQCNPTMGLWYDMEDADSYKAKHGFNPRSHKEELTDFCLIFMEDVKQAGYDNVGVYASYDYFKNILDLSELRKAGKIWLAHWGISKPSIKCNLWQYSSNGTVKGITGMVDMDYIYDDNIKPNHTEYYPAYIGSLPLAGAMASLGINSTFSNRAKIAVANGIVAYEKDYKGTLEQNIAMFKLLKNGSLKKAE